MKKKEVCFRCGHDVLNVFEIDDIIIFQCDLCKTKWGKYNFLE